MDKRTFLKRSALSAGALFLLPAGKIVAEGLSAEPSFTMQALPYAYDALEPYFDARTMEIHYTKHYASYTDKFNQALVGRNQSGKTIEQIMATVSGLGDGVRNQGGGYYNHTLFWNLLAPAGTSAIPDKLASAINASFGSMDNFRKEFTTAALSVFGSGWAWLVAADNKLVISTTPNQDNPLMDVVAQKGKPVLALDVWEHAYYLKYQNKRAGYIEAFFNIVNWQYAEKLLFGTN